MKAICIQQYHSPCGDLLIGSYENALCLCNWVKELHAGAVEKRLTRILKSSYRKMPSDITRATAEQLDEYFARQRTSFDIPLLLAGTDFQKRVWNTLLEIPYGQTVSYGELAKRIGKPAAVRAVANAIGANAISVIVPCHRVTGSDHTLTGYGGGIAAKRMLLALESLSAPDIY